MANTSINATVGYTNALHDNLYTAATSSDSYVENQHSIRPAIQLNTRIKKRHQLKYGFEGAYHFYKLQDHYSSPIFSSTSARAFSNTFQASTYVQWSYRISEKFLLNAGASLNMYRSIYILSPEPRASVEYRITSKETFALSAGMHSRLERLSYYLLDTIASSKKLNNKGLGPTKYAAVSASYRHQISKSLSLIIEAYFQYLYDVPVNKITNGSWSALNNDYTYPKTPLKNIGSGRNYGVELTLQKNFSKNYYFMGSASIYKAEQRLSLQSPWHSSRYDGGFILNGNGGKDFKIGKLRKNTLGLNARVLYAGGMRVSTPSRYYNGKKYVNILMKITPAH